MNKEKKYVVIGNPIEHSLSPQLHSHWFKKNNIKATYEKKRLEDNNLENLILELKKNIIDGINVTVPFKKKVIKYLDKLSPEANDTQSVNTIYLDINGNIIGHNTDIVGFVSAINDTGFSLANKKVLILGAGGVVPSIVYGLNSLKVSEITIMNRTKQKSEELKKMFQNLKVIEWGDIPNFDLIINATSVGINKNDKLNLNFEKMGTNKFFYDVIYNPAKTDFLIKAKELGNQTENGKKMFLYQAAAAFEIWHGFKPELSDEIFDILDK